MMDEPVAIPPGYSYPATAIWFLAGAAVTAVFSGSLAVLAKNVELSEVLLVGMLVPSFTWIVQSSAAAVGLRAGWREVYFGDLARICLIGSVALLPAAFVNLCVPQPPHWLSVANVLASVVFMGTSLFRLCARHGIPGWPVSWCLTITVNMGLFLWSSWHWW